MGTAIVNLPSGFLNRIISKITEGVCVLDENGAILFANDAAEKMLGWSQTELYGKLFSNIVHLDPHSPLRQVICNEGSLSEYTDILIRKDKAALSVRYAISPLKADNGANWNILIFQAGTTERKMLSYRYIFESNMFGVIYGDIYGRILDANEVFLNMIGYTRDDLICGKIGWQDLTPEAYRAADKIAVQQLMEHGAFSPYEKQLTHQNGSRIDILAAGMLEEGSRECAVAFIIDTSAKKRAERASVKGEELFRCMADSSNVLVWFFTPDFKLHYINKTVESYIGATLEEWPDWEWIIHPDDLPHTMQLLAEAFEKKTHYENMTRILQPNGAYRWVYSSGGPVFSEEKEFLGFVGTGVDIHDLKETQAQLTQYARKLEQSNKELEHFATIASHDLQEPLRKIRIFTDHLSQVTQGLLNAEALDDMDRIQNAAYKMQVLITDLLDLSRITRKGQPFQKVDLRALIEEVIAALHYDVPDIRERVELNGNMMIDADPGQIHQMIAQLLDNALKFHVPDKPSFVHITIEPALSDQCRIIVTDNGLGMKPEHLSKIFETFVRLHPGTEFSGTGIGLALVRKIVDRHLGGIIVSSELDQGSTFTVTLPVSQKEQ